MRHVAHLDTTTYVADVAVLDAGSAPDLLTYAVPASIADDATPGLPVQVSVRGRLKLGYIVRLYHLPTSDPLSSRVIPCQSAPPGAAPLSVEELSLAGWLADYCITGLGDAIRAVRPAALQISVRRTVRLTTLGLAALRGDDPGVRRSPSRLLVMETLRARGGSCPYSKLVQIAGSAAADSIRLLASQGLLEEVVETVAATRSREVAAVSLEEADVDAASLTAAQKRVVETLRHEADACPVATLMKAAAVTRGVIDGLVTKGVLIRTTARVRRAPSVTAQAGVAPIAHTDEQAAAISEILADLHRPPESKRPILVHGVTASGKTEVYLEAIRSVRATGRGAIVLVPEIALASQVVDLIAARFGDDVAVLHSRLANGERCDEWQRVAAGEAGIAVGARSAVFAPVKDIGLIVIDEEHEAAYKQESAPRYHARDVAYKRARDSGATVVLGSATPSLESYHAALAGQSTLVTLEKRATGAALPQVEIVDMRQEFRTGAVMFSAVLLDAMRQRLDRGEQMLLFLNRRGYAAFVLCRDCGYVAKCPQCSVSLTYHAAANVLRCHHCGHAQAPPLTCPDCEGARLRGFGLGTERIQEELARLLPEARVIRMDRDTTARKDAHGRLIRAFRNGEADILIGTQMVAKGLDFPRVTLVGVVSADVGLHIPDFRAAERSFQLLAQVAGRAGRADVPGQVLIQTFTPEHYAIQCAARQDYRAFYTHEIAQRRELRYPPFVHLANIVAAAPSHEAARDALDVVKAAIRSCTEPSCTVTGPAPAPLERLKGDFRWHLLLRSVHRQALNETIRTALKEVRSSVRQLLTVDLDPMSLA